MCIGEQCQNTFKMAVNSHSAIKVAPTVWCIVWKHELLAMGSQQYCGDIGWLIEKTFTSRALTHRSYLYFSNYNGAGNLLF